MKGGVQNSSILDTIHAEAETEISSDKKRGKKRFRYTEHLRRVDVEKGISEQRIFEGELRINAYNPKEAYKRDVFIKGEMARNRALDLDRVYVELLYNKKKPSSGETKTLLEGKVVAISKHLHRKRYAGILQSTRQNYDKILEEDKYMFFIPFDKRMTKMFVPAEECSGLNLSAINIKSTFIFVARELRWSASSLYPYGQLTEMLGSFGDTNAEIEAAVIENDFDPLDYVFDDDEHLRMHEIDYSSEKLKRADYTQHDVFTIDPELAQDLDDAISIRRHDDEWYQVSVHIADVSHFVTLGSEADIRAQRLTTSVYLPGNIVLPMLPPTLSLDQCSLFPNVDRLTITVSFLMNKNGEFDCSSSQFEKSVIRSKMKLTYEDAQRIIEEDGDFVRGFDDQIVADIRTLNVMAAARRKSRLEAFSKVDVLREAFGRPRRKQVDSESSEHEVMDSHVLVHELMVIANYIAGMTVAKSNSPVKVLREHPAPLERRIEEFKFTFRNLLNEPTHPLIENYMEYQLNRCLSFAKYTLATDEESNHSHYGLNLTHYTHFTSPIRRYADILVHRIISNSILNVPVDQEENVDAVRVILERCNENSIAAKRAEEDGRTTCIRCSISNTVATTVGVLSFTSNKESKVFVAELNKSIPLEVDGTRLSYDKQNRVLTRADQGPPIKLFGLVPIEVFVSHSMNVPQLYSRFTE
ncbi:hypothetical protein AKO1_011719 [Acrasis kona]|uniref:RNB domain-containing protein n=1 Tax=Acrasis kona TaxID=1008807 RepID=A0AAW2Z800_9EUKA